jgi:hypothetical protein
LLENRIVREGDQFPEIAFADSQRTSRPLGEFRHVEGIPANATSAGSRFRLETLEIAVLSTR